MEDSGSGSPGRLFGSVKAVAATLLAIFHTRFELFSTELEEEWIRLSHILIWSLVGVFCAGLGIVFAVLFLVLLLWDTHRLLALGVPAILFFFPAVLAWRVVLRKLRARPRLFAASLAELEKDRGEFSSRP